MENLSLQCQAADLKEELLTLQYHTKFENLRDAYIRDVFTSIKSHLLGALSLKCFVSSSMSKEFAKSD